MNNTLFRLLTILFFGSLVLLAQPKNSDQAVRIQKALGQEETLEVVLKIEDCQLDPPLCISNEVYYGQSHKIVELARKRYREKLQALGHDVPLEKIKIEIVNILESRHYIENKTIYATIKAKVKAFLDNLFTNCDWPWVNCHEVQGTDISGNNATFRLILLASDINWVFASFDKILSFDRPFDFRHFISSPKMAKILQTNKVLDIICVGMASSEGPRFSEESRALTRGQKLASWTKNHLPKNNREIPIYVLNLGQNTHKHQGPSTYSKHQRSILLIGVVSKEKGVELAEALWDAIKDRQFSGFSIRDYSKGKPNLELSLYGGL